MIAGGGGLIDLLLLGPLFGGRGGLFGGGGGGGYHHHGGRYGRDVMPVVQEAEALEADEPTSEQDVNVRDKRQLPFPMGAGLGMSPVGLGVPPVGLGVPPVGFGVPPMVAPIGGLGITGSPLTDLLLLGTLFGDDDYHHHRRHHFKRAVEELLQEAEPLETEEQTSEQLVNDPTSEQVVNDPVTTGGRVRRQILPGLMSPLGVMGGDPLVSLLLLGGLYGNGGIFGSSPMGGHHHHH